MIVPLSKDEIVEWLLQTAGPVIRYRITRELALEPDRRDLPSLQRDLLACPEVRKWLNRLTGRSLHGSTNSHLENVMAKLLEYGLRAGIREFDERMQPYVQECRNPTDRFGWRMMFLTPFLVRAGYCDNPALAEVVRSRIDALYKTACKQVFDVHLSREETASLPKPWCNKPIFRPECDVAGATPLPTCYDFYALACFPKTHKPTVRKIQKILDYIMDPRFQSIGGGCAWDPHKRTGYAFSIQPYLPGFAGRKMDALATAKLVLYLDMVASIPGSARYEWVGWALQHLDRFRSSRGTWRFPAKYLLETTGYHLYSGRHMGLGENRRAKEALELESTFRMLRIKKLLGMID